MAIKRTSNKSTQFVKVTTGPDSRDWTIGTHTQDADSTGVGGKRAGGRPLNFAIERMTPLTFWVDAQCHLEAKRTNGDVSRDSQQEMSLGSCRVS